MSGRIYLLSGEQDLQPLVEAFYDSERLLQELLAQHPDLLAGEQINAAEPRRWLLIKREMGVPGKAGGGTQWFLDHLFLDQDSVPTLVEVKRSTNTQIRREVVGQMLDYAANAVVYWPVEEVRAAFMSQDPVKGKMPEELLAEFLGPDGDPNDFWQKVKTNLQAGRIRMVFVADAIPPELRRIVEFLNEQMDPAEVLAIEVKQYVGTGVKTLVPRVIGQTETARQKKSSASGPVEKWDEASFMDDLRQAKGEAATKLAKEILDWITPQASYVWWGYGEREGGIVPVIQHGKSKYHLFRMASKGRFVFRFDWLMKTPIFAGEAKRKELLARINAIPGVHFGDDVLKKGARIPFDVLIQPDAQVKLKAAVSFIVDEIESGPAPEDA